MTPIGVMGAQDEDPASSGWEQSQMPGSPLAVHDQWSCSRLSPVRVDAGCGEPDGPWNSISIPVDGPSQFDPIEVGGRHSVEPCRELLDRWAVLSFTQIVDTKGFAVDRASRGTMSLFIETVREHGLSIGIVGRYVCGCSL